MSHDLTVMASFFYVFLVNISLLYYSYLLLIKYLKYFQKLLYFSIKLSIALVLVENTAFSVFYSLILK